MCFNIVDKCTIDFICKSQVRLQSKGGRHSSVVFCTNGILLRVLVGKGSVSSVSDITHIIVVLYIFLICSAIMCLLRVCFICMMSIIGKLNRLSTVTMKSLLVAVCHPRSSTFHFGFKFNSVAFYIDQCVHVFVGWNPWKRLLFWFHVGNYKVDILALKRWGSQLVNCLLIKSSVCDLRNWF